MWKGNDVLEHGISIALCWVVDIGIVEEILDTEKDLRKPYQPCSSQISFSCPSWATKVLGPRVIAIEHHPEFIHSLGNEQASPLEG